MRFSIVLLVALTAASPALAHTGLEGASSLWAGFLHPLGGLDHVLAMVAVGLLAVHLGGRALWLVPATFVAMMVIGGAAGMSGIGLPMVETGIALSVVALGGLIALRPAMTAAIAAVVAGAFAVFHGHAHGAELPGAASGIGYMIGFVLATTLLHIAGILAGLALVRTGIAHGVRFVRAAGAGVAVAGVTILAGAF